MKKSVVVAIPRWIKAVFFFTTMFVSLLVFSAPVLLVVADAVLPSALFSVSLPPSSSPISAHLRDYDFRSSLIDVPLVSILRSAIIFCVYSFCDRPGLSRGPYLAITTACSVASLVFVSLKASYIFIITGRDGGIVRAMEVAMFASSLVLAIGHVAVAYRTSCKERRKLLVYKIDIEAVSACKKGFLIHQKILQDAARTK